MCDNELVKVVAGDTDSVVFDSKLITKNDIKTIEELFNKNINNNYFQTNSGHEIVACEDEVLNWDDKLYFGKVKYIMRHRVCKPKWKLITKTGEEIIVTNDHSMIIFRDGVKMEVKPCEILKSDKVLVVKGLQQLSPSLNIIMEWVLDEISSCECVGGFENEYVYDIEMDDPSHTFIANNILVHNSLYLSYKGLLDTIEGVENMSPSEIGNIIARLNTEFLDEHNEKFMADYYNIRHCKSVHKFELETIAQAELRLGVKKRYAQLLFWKDGKVFETVDQMPLKVKGLEMVKSSYPKQAREALKRLTRFFLEDEDENFQSQRLNIEMQKEKRLWMEADLEDICGSVGVQNYTKYILDDTDPLGLKVAPKCPFNCRALGTYNWIRNTNNLPGDPLYGGKMKWYLFSPKGSTNKSKLEYFAFQSKNYPKWAARYAPINRDANFKQFVVDPFNRILEAVGLTPLSSDGSMQVSLF